MHGGLLDSGESRDHTPYGHHKEEYEVASLHLDAVERHAERGFGEDPFGMTEVRRVERALIGEYEEVKLRNAALFRKRASRTVTSG